MDEDKDEDVVDDDDPRRWRLDVGEVVGSGMMEEWGLALLGRDSGFAEEETPLILSRYDTWLCHWRTIFSSFIQSTLSETCISGRVRISLALASTISGCIYFVLGFCKFNCLVVVRRGLHQTKGYVSGAGV